MMKKFTNYLNSFISSALKFWIFITIAVLPLLLSFFFLFMHWQEITSLEERVDDLANIAEKSLKKRSLKFMTLKKYSNSNPYYLNHYLEPLLFCENEIHLLNRLSYHPAFSKNEQIKERLVFLKSENTMKFAEESTNSTSFLKETEEHLCTPIQIDIHDLEKILSLIEGRQINEHIPPKERPQLFIKSFSLTKKRTISSNEIFDIEMQLIKREFTL